VIDLNDNAAVYNMLGGYNLLFYFFSARCLSLPQRERVSYTRLSRLTHWSCTSL